MSNSGNQYSQGSPVSTPPRLLYGYPIAQLQHVQYQYQPQRGMGTMEAGSLLMGGFQEMPWHQQHLRHLPQDSIAMASQESSLQDSGANQAQQPGLEEEQQLQAAPAQESAPQVQLVQRHAPVQRGPLSTAPPITPGDADASLPHSEGSQEAAPGGTPDAASMRLPAATRGTRGRGRGGSRGTRRRKSSGAPLKQDDSVDDTDEEEFTMEGIKTKSGRKVHRPTQFDPAAKTPTRRRGPYRRFHDSRICKICQRGHSPQSNMIVFCDGCNTPYHQLCHDPPIDDLVIAVAEAEWFCCDCSKTREERPLVMGMPGASLTDDEKRTYLASLPMGSLVELLFFCEKKHPDLPIYDPNTKSIVQRIKAAALSHKDGPVPITPGRDAAAQAPVNGDAALVGARGRESINYEELIIRALTVMNDPVGVQPKIIWEWLKQNYPNLASREVRAEAQNPLQKLLRNNRIIREGHQYRVNFNHPQNASSISGSASNSTYTATPSRIAQSNRKKGLSLNDNQNISTSIPSSQASPTGLLLPGAGIKLPPETEDDAMLVEDEADRAFSHKWIRTGLVGVVTVATAQPTGSGDVLMKEGDDDGDGDVDAEGVEDIM